MRILIVSQYFWPENFRINDLAVELINRNHDVTILTGLPNYPSGNIYNNFLADPNRYSNFNGAKVFRVPMLPRGKGKAQLILNYLSFAISASIFGIWKLRRKNFDVIFIDGGHEYHVVQADLENCRKLAHKDTIIIMDDTMYTTGWEQGYTTGPTKAWVEFLEKGIIKEIYRADYQIGRGMSWGKYVF